MVEFCPRCGSILIPERKGGKAYLVCKKCGYSKLATKGDGYKRSESIPEEKKVRVSVSRVSEEGRESEKLEEERELLKEYYEVFLETMEEAPEE